LAIVGHLKSNQLIFLSRQFAFYFPFIDPWFENKDSCISYQDKIS
jgi:hypothetical protein